MICLKTGKWLLVVGLLLTIACSRWDGRIRGSDLTNVRLGMTKQQVIEVLGNPQSMGASDKYEVFRYYEDHGNWRHVYHGLVFVDDKLKFYGLSGSPDFQSRIDSL